MMPALKGVEQAPKILDVGCGTRKVEPSAIGIDVHPGSAADIIWDLNLFPWPLESNAFDKIYLSHIIEHVQDLPAMMKELFRVARDGADLLVVTPHYSSHNSYTDPTHVRHLAARSFQYFTGEDFASFRGGGRFSICYSRPCVELWKEFYPGRHRKILSEAKSGVVRAPCRLDLSRPGYKVPSESV